MTRTLFLIPLAALIVSCSDAAPNYDPPGTGQVADHRTVSLVRNGEVPEADILAARNRLAIGYGHTSHGSQITDGMQGLVEFANDGNLGGVYSQDLFAWSHDGAGDSLHLFEGDGYGDGPLDHDAGYYPSWYDETIEFLEDPDNGEFNVIMWSWCGQLSGYTGSDLTDRYLSPMSDLERAYPDIVFIYMTGHLDGTGIDGNLHQRNEEIRQFCDAGGKWLFDFADIESYDPDGNSYLDMAANDACEYDSDNNGSRDSNWAIEWQSSHTEGVDWFSCGSAHSQPLNANMKALAFWWLLSRIAAVV